MTKKAFVRYDGGNKAVSGSLIIRDKAPKVGTWKEVPYDLCCNGSPVTIPGNSGAADGIAPSLPSNTISIYISCADFTSTALSIVQPIPTLTTAQEYVDYLNATYSYIGTFTYVVNPADPTLYIISIETNTTFLNGVFNGLCNGYLCVIQNFLV